MTVPTTVSPTLSLASDNDAMSLLAKHYPEVKKQLDRDGYEFAGEDMVGRCQGDMTLFLELNANLGTVKAWVYDVKTSQFVGEAYEVNGPLGAATGKARHLVESVYAEDVLSGTAVRHSEQTWEQVYVA